MANGWEKMTRWAGFGENGRDSSDGSGETMVDEMKDGETQVVDRVEAGTEAPAAEAEAPDALQVQIAQLKGEKDVLVDRLARLQAEFDNARKREAKERAESREYAIGNAVEPFLSVMDNFQLALKAEGTVEQLRSGVGLILRQMEDALKSQQVTPVETVGTQFDPRIHEALGSIETAEFPDHQVVEEIRRGYKIRERLLRPAMVKIAVNKAVVEV